MLLPPFEVTFPEGGTMTVTLHYEEEGGARICGLYHLSGRLPLPPKAWVTAIRREFAALAGIARAAGCTEFRLAGRDWSGVFPDFERLEVPGLKNVLRKAL